MKKIVVKDKNDAKTIYSGTFSNIKQLIENAIENETSLSGVDLRNAALNHANLDGGDFRNAILDGCSLCDANLSEADFTGASLRDCDLTNACLCDSRLWNVDFTDASFSATLIAGASVENCTFTCPTVFGLDFAAAYTGQNRFICNGTPALFTGAPVVITGLPKRIVLLDDMALVGNTLKPRDAAMDAHIKHTLLKAAG